MGMFDFLKSNKNRDSVISNSRGSSLQTPLPLDSIEAEILWFIMGKTYQTGGEGVMVEEIYYLFESKRSRSQINNILISIEQTGAIESYKGQLGLKYRAK